MFQATLISEVILFRCLISGVLITVVFSHKFFNSEGRGVESRKLHFPKASQVKSNDQPDLGFPGLSNLPKATAHDLGLGRLFMDIILMPCVFVFALGKKGISRKASPYLVMQSQSVTQVIKTRIEKPGSHCTLD